MNDLSARDRQALIWDYYKPRHTHAWNMLVLSWRELDRLSDETDLGFGTEYCWENFILRLWLYRTTVNTLTKLPAVESGAKNVVAAFDGVLDDNGENGLKALRNMIEHFDDYAAGAGRGPAIRERDLDPWRTISRDRYERGQYVLERRKSYDAAVELHSSAKS
jgi:hypothetical protein